MTEFLTWNDFYPWVFSEETADMILAVAQFLLIAVCVVYFAAFTMERYVCRSITTAGRGGDALVYRGTADPLEPNDLV